MPCQALMKCYCPKPVMGAGQCTCNIDGREYSNWAESYCECGNDTPLPCTDCFPKALGALLDRHAPMAKETWEKRRERGWGPNGRSKYRHRGFITKLRNIDEDPFAIQHGLHMSRWAGHKDADGLIASRKASPKTRKGMKSTLQVPDHLIKDLILTPTSHPSPLSSSSNPYTAAILDALTEISLSAGGSFPPTNTMSAAVMVVELEDCDAIS